MNNGFLYPYYSASDFTDDKLRDDIGDMDIESFLKDDSSYLANVPFYAGLFKKSSLQALFKVVYGLFLFEDNYHDFTDKARVNTSLLFKEDVDTFYLNVIKYTTEPWFFNLYRLFDAVINENKRGDRKEDTIIRLFQLHGGDVIWSRIFPGDEHAFKRRLLVTFFIQRVFLSPVPIIRVINQRELSKLSVRDIKNDMFLTFKLDKQKILPQQRRNFTAIFKAAMSPKMYSERKSATANEKIDVMSDAISFPYKYTGFNEFIDNFNPRASAQTLWDGATMDTFEGNVRYDITSDKPYASKLHSMRSALWNVEFDKKKDNDSDSNYTIRMKYADSQFTGLNKEYILSSGQKGYSVKHMFDHAAYIKYTIDYINSPSAALYKHVVAIYNEIVKESTMKSRNMKIKPIYLPTNISSIGVENLRRLLLVPIDGKGTCDAEQAIYAGYRDYGFTTLDALCYFSGILNRTTSAYVVSSTGRITLSKFIKNESKLKRQKEEFMENKMAIQFKELINFFTKLNEYMNSLDTGYQLLMERDILYKNDERTSTIIGEMLRSYYLYVIEQNKEILNTIRQSQAIYNILKQMLSLIFETTGARGATIDDIEKNIDALFEILQEKRVFDTKLDGEYYSIYLKVHNAILKSPPKPEGSALFFDLFNTLYISIEGIAARFRNVIYYKKGVTGAIKLDIFTACNFEPLTKISLAPYFVIKNKKYSVTDVNGTIFIDKFMDALEEIDIIWKQLYIVRDNTLTRRNITLVEKLCSILADFMDIRIDIDYENDTVEDILDKVEYAIRTVSKKSMRGGGGTMPKSVDSAETLSIPEARASYVDMYDELESDIVRRVGNTFYNGSPGILIGFIFTLILLHEQYIGISSAAKMTPLLEGGEANPMNEIIDNLQNMANYLSYAIYETPGDPALIVKADTMINDMLAYLAQPTVSSFATEAGVDYMLRQVKDKLTHRQTNPSLKFKSDYLYDVQEYPVITDAAIFKDECIKLLLNLNFLCMSIKFEEVKELSPVRVGTRRKRPSSPQSTHNTKKKVRNKNTA